MIILFVGFPERFLTLPITNVKSWIFTIAGFTSGTLEGGHDLSLRGTVLTRAHDEYYEIFGIFFQIHLIFEKRRRDSTIFCEVSNYRKNHYKSNKNVQKVPIQRKVYI